MHRSYDKLTIIQFRLSHVSKCHIPLFKFSFCSLLWRWSWDVQLCACIYLDLTHVAQVARSRKNEDKTLLCLHCFVVGWLDGMQDATGHTKHGQQQQPTSCLNISSFYYNSLET